MKSLKNWLVSILLSTLLLDNKMPEASFYRVSCVDPNTNKQKHKQFSLKKYTKEQAEKLAEEWKKSIRGEATEVHNDSSSEDEPQSNISEIMKQFPVEEFEFERNPDKAMSACSFGIIGSSKSGKTTFLKHLLKEHFKDDIKLFMTQSPQADIYNTIRKSTVFCPDYVPEMIKECYKINKDTNNHYPFCFIIDDVVGAKNDKQMTKALCLYRNSRCSTICVGQDFSMLNPTGRANVNNICLFYSNTDNRIEDNIKLFLRSYLPRTLTMEEKIVLYRKLTENHCFLWIDCLNNTIKRCRLSAGDM
jgi:hypothetical protein